MSPQQKEALRILEAGSFLPALEKEDDGWHARWRAIGGANAWVDEYVREAALTPLSEDAEDQRHETLHDAWILALRSRTGLVRWDDAECAAFAAELEAWQASVRPDDASRRALAFELVPDASGLSVRCPAPRGRAAYRALGEAAYVWGPLRGLRRSPDDPRRLAVRLSAAEAEAFVRSGARDLAAAGYTVTGTDLRAAVSCAVELTSGDREPSARTRGEARARLTVRVAGEAVTADEIRFLLDQGSSLVFFRDRWIEVDRNILREALRALERNGQTVANPLAFALGLGHVGSLEIEELKVRGWLRGLVARLRAAKREILPAVDLSRVKAELRPYQLHGARWLRFLTDNGFGALLADDMGLGKTLQVLSWIAATHKPKDGPVLVVAPLTLLANWAHECAKFTPALNIYVHQGESRHVASGFGRTARESDVVITSYNLLVRDYSALSEVAWSALVLDEAQTVKNPDTQAARAIKALSPRRRVALTGTPVENSVADLWAIEDFLNPGFLGDRRAFELRFVRPTTTDAYAAQAKRLRQALEPFVLRRVKTAPEIASELGAKREIREYCALSPSARQAYETVLADFREGEHRAGDVFAMITSLKLVCDGFGTAKGPLDAANGKTLRLLELLEQIFAAGESALVFTQYVKVGAALVRLLEARFGRRFPFLHGALTPKGREEEIRRFNAGGVAHPSAFVLSLRSGGFGLNLTKATHVIHFDRWWNPAVESQATDRAHRIGQRRTVFVHVFITSGTLEEHVDEILAKKTIVAESVITEAEWLKAAQLEETA